MEAKLRTSFAPCSLLRSRSVAHGLSPFQAKDYAHYHASLAI
ncbi:hypothetical protein [Moorena producens]|nr:hypothetical protein [Moorena producens]